ncbi:MAG: response regulator transcription factor [Lachnospiraceae bacterium]|nr:response regulator transcription factor [Lachnospiraceae bacterium]
MKVLIIEDESYIAKSLENKLKKLRPDIEIIGVTTDIPDSQKAIASHPDLNIIFSDIKIDDGLSFSIFDSIETSAHIVFTTAFDEYALKAFDYEAIDYLVKPVSEEALERALTRYEKSRISPNVTEGSTRLLIERGQESVICDIDDICFIHVQDGATRVYVRSGLWGTVNSPLTELSAELPTGKFIRINRQTIVNLDYIGNIASGPGRDSTVKMKAPFDNTSFIITQERKKRLISLIS